MDPRVGLDMVVPNDSAVEVSQKPTRTEYSQDVGAIYTGQSLQINCHDQDFRDFLSFHRFIP